MELKDIEYKTADPSLYGLLKSFAKENRQKPTEAEAILWEYLRERQLGQPFRRQHVIGEYIADFCCIPAKLVVEIDGRYHQLPQQKVDDDYRQKWLEKQGFTVVRFTNEQVLNDIDNVLEIIEKYL